MGQNHAGLKGTSNIVACIGDNNKNKTCNNIENNISNMVLPLSIPSKDQLRTDTVCDKTRIPNKLVEMKNNNSMQSFEINSKNSNIPVEITCPSETVEIETAIGSVDFCCQVDIAGKKMCLRFQNESEIVNRKESTDDNELGDVVEYMTPFFAKIITFLESPERFHKGDVQMLRSEVCRQKKRVENLHNNESVVMNSSRAPLVENCDDSGYQTPFVSPSEKFEDLVENSSYDKASMGSYEYDDDESLIEFEMLEKQIEEEFQKEAIRRHQNTQRRGDLKSTFQRSAMSSVQQIKTSSPAPKTISHEIKISLVYQFWISLSDTLSFMNKQDRRIESIGRMSSCDIQLTSNTRVCPVGDTQQMVIIKAKTETGMNKCRSMLDHKFPDFRVLTGNMVK